MIDGRFKYTMLLSSLPLHPPNLLTAQQTPVSRIQLDKRLALLDDSDAQDLSLIEALLHWNRITDQEDEFIVKHDKAKLESINNTFIKEIVLWRLELRTIMSALRKRRASEDKSAPPVFHGFGKWPGLIIKHWHEKDFGIGHLLPWIHDANSFIEQDKTLELEKMLLNLVWRHYARIGSSHYFDFPAVVIYVLRWDVINRWSSYDKDLAILHFDELVSAELAEYSLPG